MLLLANIEQYTDYLAKGALRCQAEPDSFQARMDEDEGLYAVSGSDAVIQISGPLMYKFDFWAWLCGGNSYRGLQKQIRAAEANSDISRIVLLVDTPGGEVTGCKETADIIASCTKPVDAAVDPLCASAGLWLASQCRKITCIESGSVGSLGVQAVMRSYHRMFQEAGIDYSIIRASISPDKNLGSPYEEMTDAAKEQCQKLVDKWGEIFLQSVASGRNVSRDVALNSFGQGRMLDADEALSAGLIDAVGTVESVLSERETPKVAKASARFKALKNRG